MDVPEIVVNRTEANPDWDGGGIHLCSPFAKDEKWGGGNYAGIKAFSRNRNNPESYLQWTIAMITSPIATARKMVIACIEQGTAWRTVELQSGGGYVTVGRESNGPLPSGLAVGGGGIANAGATVLETLMIAVEDTISNFPLPTASLIYLRNVTRRAVIVTGLTNGLDGRIVHLACHGDGPIVLVHDDFRSDEQNRFDGTWRIEPRRAITLRYDGVMNRWTSLS